MQRVALVVLVLVGACRASGPTHDQCRDAVRASSKDAIAVCRSVYEATSLARDGAWLARALADRGGSIDEVRTLAERVGDREGGAEAWNALGSRLVASDHAGAIAAFRRALDHRSPTDHRNRARDASALLEQHSADDEDRLALEHAGIANEESKRAGEPVIRASVLVAISNLLYNLGDLPAVELLLREGESAIDVKSPFYPHRRQLEGIVSSARGRFELAERALRETADLAHQRGWNTLERYAQLARITNATESGRADAALSLFATLAIPAAETDDDIVHEAFVRAQIANLQGNYQGVLTALDAIIIKATPARRGRIDAYRGRALAHLDRTTEAEAALRRSIEYIESSRAALAIDALKPWLLREWQHAYEDLFALYVQQGRPFDAFTVVQQATARSMLDGLVSRDSRVASETALLEDAATRFDGLHALMRSLRSSSAVSPVAPQKLLAELGDRHLVTFFAADKVMYRIVTRGDAVPRIERVAPVAELAALADALLRNIDDATAARALGAHMFPNRALPARDSTLYVAIADPLHQVPLAALIVDGDFLIRRHPIAAIPNAAVLARLARRSTNGTRTLVLGDAKGDLAAARLETSEVAAALHVAPKLGNEATRALFDGKDVRVLHVATHTRPTALGPALELADGLLTSGEIVDRGISADVVVMTGCASADPTIREELGSLANAFLASGSRSVVATRWSVDDEVARTFARHFYIARGSESPVLATAIAQRRMLDDGAPTTSWAIFVAYGD